MTPLQRYQIDLNSEQIQADEAQAQMVQVLNGIYESLLPVDNLQQRWLELIFKRNLQPVPVRGLYMWGGVGRGKTYLMDMFYNCLPFKAKRRTHFHHLMQDIHTQLKGLRDKQNPLQLIARSIASEARVLCLDEFQVTDIADAMILARFLDALFKSGVCLVTTSNTQSDNLYKDGLQRASFLPAIELINTHTHVLNLDAGYDYRLRTLTQAQTWLMPAGNHADEQMRKYFIQLETTGHTQAPLVVFQRPIEVILRSQGVAWFDFSALCDGPRGQADYIELARLFHTLIISNIPILDWQQDDKARRFIELIDELYDRHVNLIASSDASPGQIYQGTRLKAMFERSSSRLLEMQSEQYMALEHRS